MNLFISIEPNVKHNLYIHDFVVGKNFNRTKVDDTFLDVFDCVRSIMRFPDNEKVVSLERDKEIKVCVNIH